MALSVDPSPLEGQHIDPETFRRVWQRVMPDQSGSPISLSPAPEMGRLKPPSPAPRPHQTQPRPSRPPEGEEARLRRLMDLAQSGMAAGLRLARRNGNRTRSLAPLSESCRRGLRRLSAAHFLLTGRRYLPRVQPVHSSTPLDMALRERFLWEQQWVRACLQGAEESDDPALKGLYRELAQEGETRQTLIRRVLEGL